MRSPVDSDGTAVALSAPAVRRLGLPETALDGDQIIMLANGPIGLVRLIFRRTRSHGFAPQWWQFWQQSSETRAWVPVDTCFAEAIGG